MARRRVWTTQPPAGTPIEWDNPLAQGLALAWTALDARDYVTQYGPQSASGLVRAQANFAGASVPTLAGNGSNTYLKLQATAADSSPAADFSVACMAIPNASYNNAQPVSNRYPSAGAGFDFLLASNGAFAGRLYYSGGSAQTASVSPSGSATNVAQMCWIQRQGATFYALTGTQSASVTAVSSAISATSPIAIGRNAAGQYQGIAVGLATMWMRAVSLPERLSYERNPWQIFHRRQRFYSIATTTGNSGTAAITESSDAVTASGEIQISGTASITEGHDAATASGTLTIPGTASITEGHDSVAGVGAFSGGVAAITESSDTVSASGKVSLFGAAAITESADSVFANGTIVLAGAAAITEGADTVAAYGSAAPSGSLDMPNVIGVNFYEALEILQNAGVYLPLVAFAFAPSSISVVWEKSAYAPGVVAKQSIPAGEGVAAGAAVTLTLSQYPFGSVIDLPADWKQVS